MLPGKKKIGLTPGMKFLWENDCQVWLMEKLNTVNFSTQRQRNLLKEQNLAAQSR